MSWSHEVTVVNVGKQCQKPLIDEQLQRNAKEVNEIIARIRGRAKAANQSPKCKNNDRNQQQKTKSKTECSPKVFVIGINPKQLTAEYCKKASDISNIFDYNAYFFFDKNTNTHYRKVTMPLAIELSLGKQDLDECVDHIIQAVEEQYKNTDATNYLQAMLCITYLARSGLLKGEVSTDDLLPTKQNGLQKTCIFIPDQDRAALEFILGQQNIKHKTLTVDDFLSSNRAANPHMIRQPSAAVTPKKTQSTPYTASSTYLSSTNAMPSNDTSHATKPAQNARL